MAGMGVTATDPGDDFLVDDEPGGPGGLIVPWATFVALLVAVAMLGGVVGLLLTRDRHPGSDSVDVGFYQDMTTHHEQAVLMAQLGVFNSENQTVRSMAQEIIVLQSVQIGEMRTDLETWGHSTTERPDRAMEWMSMSVPYEEMPGMATEAELDALQAARGAEADALFLELMAEHHRGGIHMAQYAEAEAGEESVRLFANRMGRSQALEVNEFAALADDLGLGITIEETEVPPLR